MESAPDAILLMDADGHVEMANAQAERMFGYTKAELVGQLLEALIPAHLRDRHVKDRNAYLKEPERERWASDCSLSPLARTERKFP